MQCDTNDNIEIALSSIIIHRSDHNFEDKANSFVLNAPFLYPMKISENRKVNETNIKLENLCKGKDIIFMQHLPQQKQITLE